MNKFIVLLMLVLALPACTNSEQAEETARQQRREAEMDKIRHEMAEQKRAEEQAPAEPEEPAAPPEPEYEEVEYVRYDGTECKERELESCGMVFSDCANGMVYRCMMNVKYTIVTKKVLVQ